MNIDRAVNLVKNFVQKNQKNIIEYSVCVIVALIFWCVFKKFVAANDNLDFGISIMGIVGMIAGYAFIANKWPIRLFIKTNLVFILLVTMSYDWWAGKTTLTLTLTFFVITAISRAYIGYIHQQER